MPGRFWRATSKPLLQIEQAELRLRVVELGGDGGPRSMSALARDMGMAEIARDSSLAAITTVVLLVKVRGTAAAAISLRAVHNEAASLTRGERMLIAEWLDPLANK